MKPGDRVKVESKQGSFEGVLMPEEENYLVLKLDTGYNISINKKQAKKIEVTHKVEEQKEEIKKTADQKKNLPKISILHTGGTIASKVSYETGGVIARFTPEEILEMFSEIKEFAQIKSRLISNMWSEDMNFNHYNILAKEIKKELEDSEGVIITHGTDTMHYTSAALSFMLVNLGKPVIIVGAQRSSDRASSDAAVNLISAVNFIVNTDYAGVALCMHEHSDDNHCVILPGTKCRKMHSSRRDAFKPINTSPIARINYEDKKIEFLNVNYIKRNNSKTEIELLDPKIKVAMLKVHTNMRAEQFLFYENYDGLIIEGLGIAGNVPINEIDENTKENTKIKKALEKIIKKGVVVAATTQTIYGGVNMNVYSTGRIMQEMGIIGNHCDMTPETAFIKLAWLLSNHPKQVKDLFGKNLRGEISENIAHETNS